MSMVETLFLIPTQFELGFLSAKWRRMLLDANCQIELCGFGPILSGIRTAQLIATRSPKQVVLIGIAGSYVPSLSLGTAVEFGEAVCYGIGVGSGNEFVIAADLGWQQWPGEIIDGSIAGEISDTIKLVGASSRFSSSQEHQLLTCCSASADKEDVGIRLRKYPAAIAEDMEGFAVAAACRMAEVPLRIVRGISNVAGDRNKVNWRVTTR